ncbi:GGDEF domain-containing protein [Nocardioides mangrovicus]|uniref:GGDEF domain-containing protein n=1 Tax=Nocardioides mangrovicus TaxID=2478913 RepID=A0A3L8P1K9_9ACTN|nr:GGDEF domain-containing protein [Nocardioides mangrovicus]RLV48713.1 GGDEF domain-containing protein [Nocardioides mangrovicus]
MMPEGVVTLPDRSIEELEDRGRHHVERTLEDCHRLIPRAEAAGDIVLLQRLRLVLADATTRRGRIEEAAQLVREVQAWAEARRHDYLIARSNRLLSAVFGKLGDTALCLEHAVAAVHGLNRDWRPSLRADHLRALGQALSFLGSFDEARAQFEDACRLTETADARIVRRMALNDIAYCEVLAERGPQAAAAADRMLAVIAAQGGRPGYEELDTAAAAYELVGRLAEAELMLAPVVDGLGADTSFSDYDGLVGCLWRLARVQRLRGRLDDARASLDLCRTRARELNSVVALEADYEHVELLAATGDYENAYHSLRSYHERRKVLENEQRVSRAASLRAIFEAEEARRDSQMFREMAERDALTGLHNRRFVDTNLPRLLLEVAEGGATLSIGLLDLDHFKRVNDTCSHAVGDEVLRRIATMIEESSSCVPGGVAARLGGEEFLVILPGIDPGAATEHLEQLRRTVADAAWRDLTGSVPVTVSIGCASAPDDELDPSALLHRADQRLYDAKDSGRNRVVGPHPGAVEVAG